MKQLGLIALALLMFVCMFFSIAGQMNNQQSLKNVPMADVKRPAAPTNPRIADASVKSEVRLSVPEFQAGKYYAGSWQIGFSGLIGAVGCATCHAEKVYRVKRGDNLTKIAKQHGLKGWGSLYRRNRKAIGGNANLIKPGQMFLVPVQFASAPSRAPGHIGKGKKAVVSIADCVVCHGQIALAAGKIDCRICHQSQHVTTAASAQAKRLVATRRAARSPSDAFYWRHPGANPFYTEKRRRDFDRVVRKWRISQEDQERAIIRIRQEAPDFTTIEVGDRFEQMAFGEYQVVDNVIAAWKDPTHLEAAKIWRLQRQGDILEILWPLKCGNIAWRTRPLPSPTPEPLPPAKVEEPTPTPEPLPPAKVEEPTPTPEPTPPAVEIPGPSCINLAWEGNAFGGSRWSVSGNARHNYAGANLALFPEDCSHGPNYYRVGPSWEGVWFDGHIAEREYLTYKGDRQVVGGKYEFFTPTTKTDLDFRFGRKQFGVQTSGGYQTDQWVSLLNFDLTHSDWETGIDAIKMLQYGFRSDWDLGGHKSSRVNSVLLPASRDPRLSGSEFSARVRAVGNEIGRTGLFPAVQLEAGYLPGPQIYAVEPRIGVELDNEGSTELAGSYRANFQAGKKNDDTAGVSLNFSLDKGAPKLWRWFKSRYGN